MKYIDNNGNTYNSIREFCKKLGVARSYAYDCIEKKGYYLNQGKGIIVKIIEDTQSDDTPIQLEAKVEIDEEYENYKSVRKVEFNYYEIPKSDHEEGDRYAIALFSDLHIEETVEAHSVLGLNEYNIDIATERVKSYFSNLATCLERDKVKTLYFGALGDNISGFIHEHLQQENGLTPPEATLLCQSLIVSGLQYIRHTLPDLNIIFIGICGNHSRTTKKVQNSNGFKLSYEWIMYQNIKQICDMLKLNISFLIPESELALIQTPDDKRYIFCHGFQVQSKGTGTVAGIYPALQRLAMKWQKVFKQDKIFLGHYHTNVSIPTATVNGSIIGYNAFALTNGMGYEEPAQQYEVYDSKIGQLLSRKIYCK